MPILQPGTPAPDFRIGGHRGPAVGLEELRGNPIVLGFSSSLANTRTPSVPVYQDILFQGHRIAILSSTEAQIAQRYGVENDASVFVIDDTGIIRWCQSGRATSLTSSGFSGLSQRELVAALLATSLAIALE